jgi:hypothetical protein
LVVEAYGGFDVVGGSVTARTPVRMAGELDPDSFFRT